MFFINLNKYEININAKQIKPLLFSHFIDIFFTPKIRAIDNAKKNNKGIKAGQVEMEVQTSPFSNRKNARCNPQTGHSIPNTPFMKQGN